MLYFVKYSNRTEIQDWDSVIRNPNFTLLTEEQIAFYNTNPNASVTEVRNCELFTPTIVEESLEEVKERVKEEISVKSLSTLDRFCSTYQLANAQCSLLFAVNSKGEVPIYDMETAQGYVDTYLRVGKTCRDKFYELSGLIDNATTNEAVEDIKTNAITFYDSL